MVWWKRGGWKFIDYLCVRLRCDCDDLTVFILKDVVSSDSSGPNSNFWVIKETLMKMVRICSRPVPRVLLVHCAVQCSVSSEMCVGRSGLSVSILCVGRSGLSVFPENDDKLQGHLFFPITQRMHNVQFVLVKIPVTVQVCPTLLADRLGLRSTDTDTRAEFSRVRTEGGRPDGLFARQNLLHAMALPIDGAACLAKAL
jgi:hypothetical protein